MASGEAGVEGCRAFAVTIYDRVCGRLRPCWDLIDVLRALATAGPSAVALSEWFLSDVEFHTYLPGARQSGADAEAVGIMFPELAAQESRAARVSGVRLLERAAIVHQCECVHAARRSCRRAVALPVEIAHCRTPGATPPPFPVDLVIRNSDFGPYQVIAAELAAVDCLRQSFDTIRVVEL
ncbi:MAG: hypothetical protein KGJ62_07690 [Armatimonadetes bacterium]|nr:hypothetical protein [Armatimonadota bacterium]MDE2207238.1 hypothetical protein [Armatimonadota bacterium]